MSKEVTTLSKQASDAQFRAEVAATARQEAEQQAQEALQQLTRAKVCVVGSRAVGWWRCCTAR